MRITFTSTGWKDYVHWQTADRAILNKVNRLIDDITSDDPFSGIGKPEPLCHHLAGTWSRRITDEHRLVYLVDANDNLVIIAARYHHDR